jgi:ABC-type nitrate/sulfonate/bicarbonate transport system substrate-binding protein
VGRRPGRAIRAVLAAIAIGLMACTPPAASPSQPAAASPPGAEPPGAAPAATVVPTRPAPVAVRVATPSESTSTLPITMAQRLGYYAEEGVELETLPMPPNVGMAALLSGEVQYSTAATSSLSMAATGAPVRMIIALADRPAHVLVGLPGLSYPDDLRGGILATSSIGGVQHREAQAAVRHYRLDPSQVTLLSTASDAVRQAALETGAVQAAVLTIPFNLKLEREGYPRLLNFAEGDLIRLPVGALSGMQDYLARNEDAVVRTLRATLRGIQAARENRSAGVPAVMEFFGIDEATAAAIYDAVAPTYVAGGRIPAGVIREALETADESARHADPDTLVDWRYLDRATQTLAAGAGR